MNDVPVGPEEFTTEWFNEALARHLGDHKVINSTVHTHAQPGQTADIYTASFEYDSDAVPLPGRMVIKATSRDQQIIELINTFDQYRREAAFYDQSADVNVPIPTCYYSAYRNEPQRIVLLLEDLAPSESPAWAISPEQVKIAAAHLAPFHARWWNQPELMERDWLVQLTDTDFYTAFATGANAAIPTVQELFGSSAEYSESIARTVIERLDKVMAWLQTRNFTLVHGDYHGKQMFFPGTSGGRFAVIDWQFPFCAQGPWDLARILALGLDTGVRQQQQNGIIDAYFSDLTSAGITQYSRDDFLDDYRMGLAVSQLIMMIATADTDVQIIDRECSQLGLDWRDVLLWRGEASLREHQVLDLIESF